MNIAESIRNIQERIREAANRSRRNAADINLIVVTKGVGTDKIREAIDAGVMLFGESRVQEARPKMDAFGKSASWHFIGHLQRNKVKYIVGEVEMIHSVDSPELCEEINLRAQKKGIIQNILLEVNISGEKEKFGLIPEKVQEIVGMVSALRNICLRGLMTIPPFSENPEDSRPYFRNLRELRDQIRISGTGTDDFRELSMGMSSDFETGIEEGATLVRVGTAIFGRTLHEPRAHKPG